MKTAQIVCAVWLITTVTTARALYAGAKHLLHAEDSN